MLIAASCMPNHNVEEQMSANIFDNVTVNEITLASSGGTQDIAIPSESKWSYFSNAEGDWLTLTQSETGLQVEAAANTSGTERKAVILLLSGKHQKRIDVSQSGADFKMSFSLEEVKYNAQGGMKIIQVSSNAGAWKLQPLPKDISWLKVTGKDNGEVIIIEVEENESYEARDAYITFAAPSGQMTDLRVAQDGKTKFYLPFDPGFDYNSAQMIRFEKERGNIMQSHTEPTRSAFNDTPGVSQFYTKSKYIPSLVYVRNFGEIKYTGALLLFVFEDATAAKHPELDEYIQMILDAGYEERAVEQGATRAFLRKDSKMIAQVQIYPDGAKVTFIPLYPQEKAYPTFDALPTGPSGFMDLLSNPKKKVADVIAFEKAQKSELYQDVNDSKDSTAKESMMFLTGKTGKQEAQRGYFFYSPKGDKHNTSADALFQSTSEIALYFDRVDLGIRIVGARNYITNEFAELLKKSGYEYLQESNGTRFYTKRYDKDRLLILYVEAGAYANVLDGKIHLGLGYFFINQPEKTSAVAQAFSLAKSGRANEIQLFDHKLAEKVIQHKALRKPALK